MSKKLIYKFELQMAESQSIEMPSGAKMLSCQMQSGRLCLWALVEPSKPAELFYFDIFGTGHNYDCIGGAHLFLSTVQDKDFVWHVFQRVNLEY